MAGSLKPVQMFVSNCCIDSKAKQRGPFADDSLEVRDGNAGEKGASDEAANYDGYLGRVLRVRCEHRKMGLPGTSSFRINPRPPLWQRGEAVEKSAVRVITRECPARNPGDLWLGAGDKVVVVEDAGAEWFRGYRLSDPAKRLGLFPAHVAGELKEGEVAAQLICNMSLPSSGSQQPLRFYRHQVVFARSCPNREGWARVRTQSGVEASLPFSKLLLPKPVANELKAAVAQALVNIP